LIHESIELHGGSVSAAGREGSRLSVAIPNRRGQLPQDRIDLAKTFSESTLHAGSYAEEAQRSIANEFQTPGVIPDIIRIDPK
jgi:hypothetical protein